MAARIARRAPPRRAAKEDGLRRRLRRRIVAAAMSFTLAERDELILEHVSLVRIIAGRLARRLPSSVDVDELVSVGTVGLIDAIDRFDRDRGVPFKGFADLRIRGAMVDYLRGIDPVSRAVRRKHNALEAKRAELRKLCETDAKACADKKAQIRENVQKRREAMKEGREKRPPPGVK